MAVEPGPGGGAASVGASALMLRFQQLGVEGEPLYYLSQVAILKIFEDKHEASQVASVSGLI